MNDQPVVRSQSPRNSNNHVFEEGMVNSELTGSERVRLFKFLTTFDIGGTEKQVVNLATRMDRTRFDLSFGCTQRWGELLEQLERLDMNIAEYPITSFFDFNTFRQRYRFARALREGRIQIMHSYNFYANVFSIPAAKIAGVPCIVASIRDLGIYLTPAQKLVQRWVCRLADRIAVNAGAIRDWLIEEGYPAAKISVIRNGLDISLYRRCSDGAAFRRELGLPADAPLVVMLSRLNRKKGVDNFLEAAALVKQRCPQTYFIVVGDDFTRKNGVLVRDLDYRKELGHLADRLGLGDSVRFTGMRTDVPDVLCAAAVSVLPSFSEGISNTLVESMAAGAPVVATRVGGTPELIEDGCHGLLVEPGDTRALAGAMCTILQDPVLAARLSAAARRRVEADYSIERMVRDTQALYFDLLREKAMPAV